MKHRAPETHLDELAGNGDDAVRIVGRYPPPPAVRSGTDVEALLVRPPRTTRYGRPRRNVVAALGAVASVLVMLLAIGCIVVLPRDAQAEPTRRPAESLLGAAVNSPARSRIQLDLPVGPSPLQVAPSAQVTTTTCAASSSTAPRTPPGCG